MSKPNRWHPCFLPGNCRQRLKQCQADCARGIVERKGVGVAEESRGVDCEPMAEAKELEG